MADAALQDNKTGQRKPYFYRGSVPVPKFTVCETT
jgi:hypothetical protein